MMNLKKKAVYVLLALCACSGALKAQDFNGLWHAASGTYIDVHGKPVLQPLAYKAFSCDENTIKAYLLTIPLEYAQAQLIALPTPDGGYRSFRIWATPMMEAPLADKYADITTYTAEAVGNSRITAKIDYTPFGFHAMIYDGEKTFFIDPYTGKADGTYIAYYGKDYSRPQSAHVTCEVAEAGVLPAGNGGGSPAQLNGITRKKYRLALSADSEYCAAVAGANPTKAAVFAKMTTSMNRVNGVYEREFSVTMVFVAKEDTLIFTGSSAFTGNNSNSLGMLAANQTVVDTRIGSVNYDIGHVFSTGAGGRAQQGCVCIGGSKARGVTGNNSPIGDSFDIDYVAHEMGHQFGAGHTFNANTGSCLNNGVLNISYEPGSGSTIMAYAGICGSGNDYQAHSDAYFHSASLEQIGKYITTGGGLTCAVQTASTNTNAALAPFSASYNIPFKTPFELTAPVATDLTQDTLTYCWEQRNIGGSDFGQSLALTRVDGPLFRSFTPSTSPTRVFPAINRLLGGLSTPGEKLPDTGRILTFGVTERDIYQGWGAFNFPGDAITLNVTQTSGPFAVTSPNGGDTWIGGTSQTITWNVSGTTSAPISCPTVDILLSLDGGYTYPYTLRSATANDGSETITVPNIAAASGTARVKVKGVGNVFFNVNFGNFDIEVNPAAVSAVALDGINVTPVPAGAELKVVLPASNGTVAASLVNTMGQKAWSGTLSGATSLPVGNFPRGVYFLQLIGNGRTFTRTVVLQ